MDAPTTLDGGPVQDCLICYGPCGLEFFAYMVAMQKKISAHQIHSLPAFFIYKPWRLDATQDS